MKHTKEPPFLTLAKGKRFLAPSLSIHDLETDFVYEKIFAKLPFNVVNEGYTTVKDLENFISKYNLFCLCGTQSLGKHFDPMGRRIEFFYSVEKKIVIRATTRHGGGSIDQSSFFGYEDMEEEQELDEQTCDVIIAADSEDDAMKYLKEFKFVVPSKKNTVYMLMQGQAGIRLRPLTLEAPETNVDLALNYGKDFPQVHEKILNSLIKKKSGLYLFYGDPGTGKSSYIRHLLSSETGRKMAYIPVNMIGCLVSPEFVPILLNNRDLILIIEDAEKALMSREDSYGDSSVVSSVLNLTDSFIAKALNVTIIATFNAKKSYLDKALLRKGRLNVMHEFKPLAQEDAQKLLDTINSKHVAKGPMTLADIYNAEEDNGYQEKEKATVGFH